MTEKLNPKLQEFEAKLRQLKPLNTSIPLQRPSRFYRFHNWHRIAACVLAITAIVIVWLTPRPQPLPVLPQIEPTVVAAVAIPKPFPTVRQQFAQLLDEMNVADPIAEMKPVYSVIEIVVCNTLPEPIAPLPIERLRFRMLEQETLSMF